MFKLHVESVLLVHKVLTQIAWFLVMYSAWQDLLTPAVGPCVSWGSGSASMRM